jgi:hypothetical protein
VALRHSRGSRRRKGASVKLLKSIALVLAWIVLAPVLLMILGIMALESLL